MYLFELEVSNVAPDGVSSFIQSVAGSHQAPYCTFHLVVPAHMLEGFKSMAFYHIGTRLCSRTLNALEESIPINLLLSPEDVQEIFEKFQGADVLTGTSVSKIQKSIQHAVNLYEPTPLKAQYFEVPAESKTGVTHEAIVNAFVESIEEFNSVESLLVFALPYPEDRSVFEKYPSLMESLVGHVANLIKQYFIGVFRERKIDVVRFSEMDFTIDMDNTNIALVYPDVLKSLMINSSTDDEEDSDEELEIEGSDEEDSGALRMDILNAGALTESERRIALGEDMRVAVIVSEGEPTEENFKLHIATRLPTKMLGLASTEINDSATLVNTLIGNPNSYVDSQTAIGILDYAFKSNLSVAVIPELTNLETVDQIGLFRNTFYPSNAVGALISTLAASILDRCVEGDDYQTIEFSVRQPHYIKLFEQYLIKLFSL